MANFGGYVFNTGSTEQRRGSTGDSNYRNEYQNVITNHYTDSREVAVYDACNPRIAVSVHENRYCWEDAIHENNHIT